MNIMPINCNAAHLYFTHVRVPNGDDLEAPTAAGQVIGIELRISATKPRLVAGVMEGGEAIDPDLDALPATEDPDDPSLFTVEISQALHQDHLLPLGRGTKFYAIWQKPGVSDDQVDTFMVATDSDI